MPIYPLNIELVTKTLLELFLLINLLPKLYTPAKLIFQLVLR